MPNDQSAEDRAYECLFGLGWGFFLIGRWSWVIGHGAFRGEGYRHWHPGRETGGDLRAIRAGRWLDEPALRRHRPGAVDLDAAGRADGRTHRAGERAGQGNHLPLLSPVAAVAGAAPAAGPEADG